MNTRRSGSTRPTIALTTLILGLVLSGVVGCSISPGPTTEAPEASPTGEVEAAEWTPCGSFECGQVLVPLDHGDPTGPTIAISMIRKPATGSARGTIFINPGGPGASGVDHIRSGFTLDPRVMEHYHLVGFDPRGVGGSAPLSCRLDRSDQLLVDLAPDTPAEVDALEAWAEQEATDCAEADGDRLAHQSSAEVAQDLDLLRQANGDDRLNYVGFSYGSHLGLIYQEMFGDRVGKMVLDGIVDPHQGLAGLLTNQATGFARMFDRLAEECPNYDSCPDAGLALTYDTLQAELESTPVGGLGPSELALATLGSLYGPSGWPTYLEALDQASQGEPEEMVALAHRFMSLADVAAYLSTLCPDQVAAARSADRGELDWSGLEQQLAERSPRFGATIANEVRACAYWPAHDRVPEQPATDSRNAGSGPADLILIGAGGDPATPLAAAQAVAARLPNTHLLIVDEVGHTSYGRSSCVRSIVTAYLVDDRLPEAATVCR